ncbi:MAG TPA: sugar phosphate isomerase/epimerase family protein [Rhodothermales bacterium]|nr:sugar phosphate isomerase/epimerase family protein [Rhodothermales bacterium]
MVPSWLSDVVTSDLDRALHYTLLWGLEGIELRTVGKPGERVPFVNEAKLLRRLSDSELVPVSVVPGMFEGQADDRLTWLNELAAFEETLAFCDRIGCEQVVVSAFASEGGGDELAAEALQRAGIAAERYGVRLAVLNELGGGRPTGRALANLLNEVAHPAVGAAWNPTHALRAGERTIVGLEALESRIVLVRCSDGVLQGGRWEPRPLGDGDVGWDDQVHRLAGIGFDGPMSLEIELKPGPKFGLHESERLIHLIRKAKQAVRLHR